MILREQGLGTGWSGAKPHAGRPLTLDFKATGRETRRDGAVIWMVGKRLCGDGLERTSEATMATRAAGAGIRDFIPTTPGDGDQEPSGLSKRCGWDGGN